ncbi:response regulator [Ramlibacter sp. Leaf400]|uniref:response regulator n=1 Tax=Ramlibacter sp. Leaf400 TaxID=1736365 RepID=UPI000B338D47|nr:response regulator [Ramlibacter sp. Leaf400]
MRSVLIVEDNRDLAKTLMTGLDPLDVDVRLAFDGREAVRQASERLPDVAVLDIGLPVMDGYEVCRRIRALPGGDRIRVVALTTWGTVQDRRSGADAGFDEHWTKPLGLDLFVDLTRRQLLATVD